MTDVDLDPVIQAKVDGVLARLQLSEARAAKLDVDELLALLSAFHDEGIHFS